MTQIRRPARRTQILFSALILVTLALLFWTGSRYPALDEKAMMSGAIQLEDPLGFEAWFPLTADMTTLERIFYSTLNWIDTNKKGMAFGVFFAAGFLTFGSYIRKKAFRSGLSNSALGMLIGAPLGVCVNCAAPIAKGMYSAGLRAETTLSAMIASPTLNVVVLTMLFSLLPVYMAVTKVVLSLAIILLVVPLICGTLFGRQTPATDLKIPPPTPFVVPPMASDPTMLASLGDVATRFVYNLGYIVLLTVPLMLLAGLLGAIAATLIPAALLDGLSYSLPILLLAAIVGVFLPVPIAFDVVVSGALLASGLAPGYVMALLFTLGSFSIYSFFIVAQAISARAGALLALAVVVLGTLAGVGAQRYHDWQSDRALDLLLSVERLLLPAARAQTVSSVPHAPRSTGDTPFTRLEGHDIGIDKPIEFGFDDMWPPFWEGRSVSSGDIDGDGDPDLVIASTEVGLYIYHNDGAGQFTRADVDIGALRGMPVFNAALVDLNDSGRPELFVTTYRQGNFVVPDMDFARLTPVANRDDAVLTLALAFDDLDRDGVLDAAIGNWATGWYRRVPGEESRNRVIFGSGRPFGSAAQELPAIPGESLSVLMSDIDLDGDADLLVGNDFEVPDAFYLNEDSGLRLVTHQDAMIPHTTTTTMAVKTADLTNDGMPEIYLAQIAGRSSGVSDILKMQDLSLYCDGIRDPADRATCDRNMAIKEWYRSGNNFDPTYASRCETLDEPDRAQCKAMLIKDLAIQRRDPSVCSLIPTSQPHPRSFCELHFAPVRAVTAAEAEASIQQILRSNVLLERTGDVYEDSAEARGLSVGGWSWDTKIADFDNDGWQDVYIVNGTWVPNEVSPSNLFFRNQGDGSFVETSGPFGLEDYLMTAAATAFDMDGDGDLDMVAHPVNGPIAVFRNDDRGGNAVTISLVDRQGNRDGIGARLVAEMGDATMMREVQMGGGFMSFDAPVVHFGLGDAPAVDRLTIHWRTGTPTVIDAPLAANHHHRISRD